MMVKPPWVMAGDGRLQLQWLNNANLSHINCASAAFNYSVSVPDSQNIDG